jgi:hypothetical protein
LFTSIEFSRPVTETGARTTVRYDSAALRLWATMSPDVAGKLQPVAALLVQEVVEEIQRTVPAYSRPLEGRFRDVLVGAVKTAIHQCCDAICDPRAQQSDWQAAFRRAGRAEFAEGRTTDPLQAAVRVGARVVWRYLGVNAHSLGIPAEALFTMADAIFAWVDELSAVAIEGYHEAQAKAQAKVSTNAMDVREMSRRHLVRAILSGEQAARDWVGALAQAARWPLPDQLVAIAVERRTEHDELTEITGHDAALVDLDCAAPCVLLADPGRNRRLVSDLVGGRRAAVGPVVAVGEADRSFALARRLLGTMQTKAGPTTRIAWCHDHLAMLLLLVDPFLTTQLREHTEAAFAGLTPKQRDRMATTLLAWLQTSGTHNEIAARLDVHPQTVRYRIHQLQELLGDKLADPDARLTMELALRAHMLLNPLARHGDRVADQVPGARKPSG